MVNYQYFIICFVKNIQESIPFDY